VTLVRRSTRSLSLTDVGEEYLRNALPALSMLRQAADDAKGSGARAAGPLRLTMPRAPFELLVAPILVAFQDAYPEVDVEIAVEARLVDIVKEGYDAGLRYGNCLEQGMVAVPVAQPTDAVLVASPGYLERRGVPETLSDLLEHHALMCRSPTSGAIIPWRMKSGGDSMEVLPRSATVVQDLASQIELAVRGMGVLSMPMASARRLLQSGKLSRVLPEWSTPTETLYIYYPSRRNQSRALRAFIDFVKRSDGNRQIVHEGPSDSPACRTSAPAPPRHQEPGR